MAAPKKSVEVVSIGAEARVEKQRILGTWILTKTRTPKGYRHAELDQRLRKERTSREAKMIHQVKAWGVRTPLLYNADLQNATLYLEYVDAPRLKHVLLDSKIKKTEKEKFVEGFAKMIATLHTNGVVHGDLTTSNVLVSKGKGRELVLIDFGLSVYSKKLEDLAVDLVNLKKTFTATHADYPEGWEIVQRAYLQHGGSKSVLKQMDEVEKRIRYA